jgi:hypothetical protein
VVLISLLFAFFLTCLFLAMRGVLDLGGFVARGGPYEIAHEAPSWVWIFPVSIVSIVLIFFFLFMTLGRRGNADLLVLLAWPALFLSLGWNFLEYSFAGPQTVAWGWLVCGVVFVLMGGAPLVIFARAFFRKSGAEEIRDNARNIALELSDVAAGIVCGYLFFGVIQ